MPMTSQTAISMKQVDVLFGPAKQQPQALQLLDNGKSREEILEQTGIVLGVADASLDVPAGSISVLMGLSGSGKSSLLRCVNGLNTVTRGVLEVTTRDGVVNVSTCKGRELRQLRRNNLAMVFQQFALLPWASVRENIGFGLSVRGESDAAIRQQVDAQLELVSLQAWADKPIHTLSGGMQQRVGLARAFATDADILLMDEPFSALDPLIREHLQDELLELQSRLKKTILFVSHDLDEALKLGNQISIMDGGRIVQTGTANDIVFSSKTDYVSRFVANINPLSVLTADAIMQPLEQVGDHFEHAESGMIIRQEADGKTRVSYRGVECEVRTIDELSEQEQAPEELAEQRPQTVHGVRPEMMVNSLLKLAAGSEYPILVQNGDGISCGLIRDSDILMALHSR
ncbi:choline ABC transporter ATP-binding protein [Granulosicoccus antarcticus]|uniref:Glycine betaine transport ATP-binding protein OpuAA n=1 Tax=Granulosicoccus antarcticus IMCC3135 TaxID=1192854 RepID=A0A2Z2NJ04_9GAMM|nr:choline ABC transporter ATP-binding protein [Granulosicoccus antarcticus]ASJ71053.1 Glycine betaine transport ATP-binding protein OpuAA [Granulosicoccus antarcticus IMCC3135]